MPVFFLGSEIDRIYSSFKKKYGLTVIYLLARRSDVFEDLFPALPIQNFVFKPRTLNRATFALVCDVIFLTVLNLFHHGYPSYARVVLRTW